MSKETLPRHEGDTEMVIRLTVKIKELLQKAQKFDHVGLEALTMSIVHVLDATATAVQIEEFFDFFPTEAKERLEWKRKAESTHR